MNRTIGPVTSTIGAAVALVTIGTTIAQTFGVTLATDVQGAITLLIVYIAGWAVSPQTALERARIELFAEYEENNGD